MLTSRTKYALRALAELGKRQGQGPIPIQDLARAQEIPLRFLEQIITQLRMLGYVESKRGPGGGHALAKSPSEFTLGDIVRNLEGPLAPISCVSVTKFQACGCPEPDNCGIRKAFKEARDALANVLDNTTFQHVLDGYAELPS